MTLLLGLILFYQYDQSVIVEFVSRQIGFLLSFNHDKINILLLNKLKLG
jgi:hypothetical protein